MAEKKIDIEEPGHFDPAPAIVDEAPAIAVPEEDEPLEVRLAKATRVNFDQAMVEEWLTKSYLRLIDVFWFVSFDSADVEEEQKEFLLSMIINSLKSGGKVAVLKELSESEMLSGMKSAGKEGKFFLFEKA